MKRINKKTKRKILLGAGIVAALVVVILIIRGVSGLFTKESDTSAGVKYIKEEEAGDISEIEEKISRLEQQENQEEDTRSIKEKFTGAVVVGDSITEGFTEYDVLNASSVAAVIGVHLYELDDVIAQVKSLSPKTIFLALGMNDVKATEGNVDEFVEQYTAVLDKIRKEVPNAHIFVNAIFPVQDKAVQEEPLFEKIPDYNKELKKLCDEQKISFIDNTELVQEQYYEQDGIHFKADFYPLWAEHMAEVAAL